MLFKINQYKLDMSLIEDMNSAFMSYQPEEVNLYDETKLILTVSSQFNIIAQYGELSKSKRIYLSQFWAGRNQDYIDQLGPFG